MPKCSMCGGSGMVRVSAVSPPYRPCPECGGSGTISNREAEDRSRRAAEREKKKDTWFGIAIIIVGLVLAYGGVQVTEDSTARLVVIGIAVACWVIGGKNL